MGILPFMGGGGTGEGDDKIVEDLIANVQKTMGEAPTPRKATGAQHVFGALSDALGNRARVMAGGLPQQGAFAQELQRVREEDEADQRDYIKARRDVDTRIRIGAAESKMGERLQIREERRAELKAQEHRQQAADDALNKQIIERGAAEGVAGDWRTLPYEQRAKMYSDSLGANSPSEVAQEFAKSGLSKQFRLKGVEALPDGRYAPILESIDTQKKSDLAAKQEMLQDLAKAGIPRETIAKHGQAFGIEPAIIDMLGTVSDEVILGRSIEARVLSLNDSIEIAETTDPDLATDMLMIRSMLEEQFDLEDVEIYYAKASEAARKAIDAYNANPADEDGMPAAKAESHMRKLRKLIRNYLNYEMPDASLLPASTPTAPEAEEGPGLIERGLGALESLKMIPPRKKKPAAGKPSATQKKTKED